MFFDILKLSIKEIKNHKARNILFVMFLTVILLMGHIAINFSYNFDKYINDGINKDLLGRTLFVNSIDKSYKEVINDVMNYENVVYAYNTQDTFLSATTFLTDNGNEIPVEIEIKPLVKSYQPTIVKGKIPTASNEMVCSIFLKKKGATTKNNLIDMTKYLNKTITISYDKLLRIDYETLEISKTYNKDIFVVGLFTNVASSDSYTECYMKEEFLSVMAEEAKIEYSEKFLEESAISENSAGTKIIVDKVENTYKVAEQLSENGYIVTLGYSIDYDSINTLKLFFNIGLIVLFIIMIIIIIIYIKNLIKKEQKNIGIFKILGYKNSYISRIILFQMLIAIIVSYLVSLLFLFIGVLIVNRIISNNLNFAFLSLQVSVIYEIVYMLFIFSLIVITSLIISSKIYKIEVKEILNANNN